MIPATTMCASLNIPLKIGNPLKISNPIKIGKKKAGNIFRFFFPLLIIFLAACAPRPDDVIRFGIASAPVTLDPRFATDATSSRVNRLIYSRLVEFNDKQLPVPGLASWEVITPQHYRFTLKSERVNFHDGSTLTANDVKATYDSVLDPGTASPHRATLNMVNRVEAVDNNTVDFYLSSPDLLFPAYLVIGILPAEKIASGHPLHLSPVGNGPFRFVSWPEQGNLVLERIKDHQVVSLIRVKDETVRVLKLVRGEIDITQNDLSPELVGYLKEQEDLHVTQISGSNFTYLGFNLEDPITGQENVRRAIAMAIDREAIIKYVMGGAAKPASALLLPEHWAGNPELKPIPFDPGIAKSLLAQSGYDKNNQLQLTYKTSTNAFRLRLATVLQSQLKEVGINVNLQSYDWGTFYGDIKAGNFQMFSLSWVGVKTPDIFRYVFHSDSVPPNGANRGRYKDDETDKLIHTATEAGEMEVQADAYRKIQSRLLEKLPYVPLWYEDHVFVVREGISGYGTGLDGNYDGLVNVTRNTR
ncbi:ABC transporter substrate-binding protein [Kaarinaea lacus]